ncbi:MAG TPA: hypothetical protein VNH18_25370, partial [Bryobacteraceae bacterium]|nr:hypothetical protein [Bryobacteraceae bacterium]
AGFRVTCCWRLVRNRLAVALSFEHRAGGSPGRVAIFPGAWNPPTVAHVAIARAALKWADEVVWMLPRTFPHKSFDGAAFEARREMLRSLAALEGGFSAAISDANLHFRMAAEAREAYGSGPEIGIISGRDAAERIATWDYGEPGVFERMLAEYPLLIAARRGEYTPDPQHADRILLLNLEQSFDEVSSTEIRKRVAEGGEWRHLVPEILIPQVASIYGGTK